MSETLLCLSEYSLTCEMIAIIDDREINNLIPNTNKLSQIIKCFLNKLNNNDKQLAIKHLMQYFPTNQYLIQSKKEFDGAKGFFSKIIYLKDYGLKKNQKIYQQSCNLNLIRLDGDFHKLLELFEQKEFLENYQIPTLFHKQKHIIEKLKHHSFKLIDLIEQCQYSSFQLNSTILSHLVFFFFIPEELAINSKEETELHQLLGEITCECWMQFEYHIQQLLFKEQILNKLKILQEIPQLLFQIDLSVLKNQIQQIFKTLLNKKDQIIMFEEIDNLIQRRLPIIFELQVIFYQICFYCMANFNHYYLNNMIAQNKDERYKQLNIYIQQKKQFGFQQFNQIQIKSFGQYQNEQMQIKDELKKWNSQQFDDLLQFIIDVDYHYLNKRQHILNLNEQNDQNAKIFNLFTEVPVEDKRKVAFLLKTLIKSQNLIDIVIELQNQSKSYPNEELELIFRIVVEIQLQEFTQFCILKQAIKEMRQKEEMQHLIQISKFSENMELNQQIQLLNEFQEDHWQLLKKNKIQYIICNTLIKQYFQTNLKNQQLQILNILRKLFDNNQAVQQYNEQTRFFSWMFSCLKEEQIHQFININKSDSISQDDYINTIESLFQLVKTIKQEDKHIFLKILSYNENLELDQQIQLLNEFQEDHWQLLKKNKIQYIVCNTLIKQYFQTNLKNQQLQILNILRKLFDNNQAVQQYNEYTQFFSWMFSCLKEEQIHQFININKSDSISQDDYINTIETIFNLVETINEEEKQKFISTLERVLIFYRNYLLNFFFDLLQDKINLDQLKKIFKLIYFWQFNQQQELRTNAQQFYRLDATFYIQILKKINYFDNEQLVPEKLELLIKSDIYPRCLNISLEEFNISLTLLNKEEQKNLVKDWIKDVKNSNNFKKLIPFFFNIIKRGESSKTFLSIINQQIKSQKKLQEQYSYFNQKSMFQIFYNNANDELKVMLLKLMSKQYPIPLLFRTPYNAETGELEKLKFNINTFYVFQDNFPIINLSLVENQKRIGKTELINKIFFQQDKFEIQDSNQLNNYTIDIMYDFEFIGSRNLSVADAHNFIPFEILDDILPMFKLWIIQVDNEEIEMTIQNLQKLQSFQIKDKIVCFLIRNTCSDLDENQSQQLQLLNIEFKLIMDLSDKDLNKQMKDDEIEQVSKFLYDIINENKKKFILSQDQYFSLICQMRHQDLGQTKEMKQAQELFQEIEAELDIQMKHDQGFYNQKAFPLRSIYWQIKQEIDGYVKIQEKKDDPERHIKLQQINQNIKHLQSQIKSQQQTKLMSKFCSLLKSPNYYILYLHFVDKIRKFNEKNTYELQAENQKLNEEIQQLKQDKDAYKSKDKDKDTFEQIQLREQKQTEINQKVLELKKNSELITKRNIGIELFWREIIAQIDQCIDSQIDIDPAKIVKEMISKGEPYEFLDGDQLKIDQPFLMKLISNFKDQGNEKILVLSVLGPQNSGKSTILNKIFGCHFWTSVGRCTKGIYLQLLKIHNKEFFNNQFDYIIILDTEGLQSPNQDDQEFDKKIALFVLSISDIILVNVKGDITREFRSLVEMCIFTLGQMKSFTSSKQITWCFNQNNDVNNYPPFLAQLQSIATSLNSEFGNQKEEDETTDYNEILGITQGNIKILGFASTEKLWKQNESDGIYGNWRQLILNGTFSEEAYEYGIKVIKAYVGKFGKGDDQQGQEKQLETLHNFIQKIETTWKMIESLPDLLEFSELIQHQQNQFLRQQFTEIISQQEFPKQNDFISDIKKSIQQNNQKLSLEALNTIEKQQFMTMKGQFDLIRNNVIDKLTAIKNEKKISKKVFTKYVNMTKDRIQSEVSACNLTIYSEIKTQENTLQNQKGWILKKEDELKEYKADDKKIQMKFDEIWGQILKQHIEQQEEMFTKLIKLINFMKILIKIFRKKQKSQ